MLSFTARSRRGSSRSREASGGAPPSTPSISSATSRISAGCCARRKSVQASVNAVVSWPAMKSTAVWPTSAASLSEVSLSSSWARTRTESTSSPSGARRRSAMSASMRRSSSSAVSMKRRYGVPGRRKGKSMFAGAIMPWRYPMPRRPSASVSCSPRRPKRQRMTTRSVRSIISSARSTVAPGASRAIACWVVSTIAGPRRSTLARENAGTIMRRWLRCSSPFMLVSAVLSRTGALSGGTGTGRSASLVKRRASERMTRLCSGANAHTIAGSLSDSVASAP